MRSQIRDEINCIEPLDDLEREHIADALGWVASDAELCRLIKPASPPKHLVSYFVVIDGTSVLLVDHKDAQRWLPTGGHVEPNEHPRSTVRREIVEELGFAAPHVIGPPLMLTSRVTVGQTAGHTDVSLWYVIRSSRKQAFQFDEGEFLAVRWFKLDEIPYQDSDPHLARFVEKLRRSDLLSVQERHT